MTDRRTIVTGVIGSDVDIIGNKILSYALTEAGFNVISLGIFVTQADFIKAAIETAADAILVSSLGGHGEIECRGFRDKCNEAGLKDIVIYVGGNLCVGTIPWETIDLEREAVAGVAHAPSTVDSDIMDGLQQALARLADEHGLRESQFTHRLACSSAAGGLRLVACGLVPDLTSEAAKQAALGAGAKVIKTFSYELGRQEIEEIEDLKPDIVQLAGGTDGGDKKVILANARKLAEAAVAAPFIVAGNKTVAGEVEEILARGGKYVEVTENVLPELNKLNVEPARHRIRELFMPASSA